MAVNNLDPPQQNTSYQQALKYGDRCPVPLPANLCCLGSSHFEALLIRRAAMEKLMKSPHVNSMSSLQQRQASFHLAISGTVVWDPLFNGEKQDTACAPPSWSPVTFMQV